MMASSALLSCAVSLLEPGRLLNILSSVVTATALSGLVLSPALTPAPRLQMVGMLIAIAAAGVAQLYLAVRVSFDAALFARVAGHAESAAFAAMDDAMTELGLLPAAKCGRAASARIGGAMRLLRLQVLALVLQVLMCVGAGILSWWR